MNLINWKTRSSNAKIFKYIENDQTDLVFRAINDGEALIHARDEKGSTLIEVAVWAQNLDLGRSLSRMGLTMANIDSAAIAASIVMPMLLS
ncbi:hypothetical protein CDV36_010507 [Fusarium kuroshium]|uniref:Uncharacterized protein n=1 Tax=Fusarium kuroshium TaxID=2010991 RepID=A0A3M2RX26_9HYPO|nr:hypothetical protein CDV36_010507 [Fusarium kuroshium]